MSGRTVWHAKDAGWWTREWIVDLGEEFGTVGPAVFDWLECHAAAQNHQGYLKTGFRAIARGVFSDQVTVRDVVLRCVTLGALTDYKDESGVIKCQIAWWEADQEKASHAERQRRYRQRSREKSEASDVLRHVVRHGDKSDDYITSHKKEEEKEESSRKRASRKPVDQAAQPADFPPDLLPSMQAVLGILHGGWELRGGLEPQVRGVCMAMQRNPRADHQAVARKLVQWLTAGNGQSAPCRDICQYLGNWVEREPASKVTPITAAPSAEPKQHGPYVLAQIARHGSVGA